MMRYTKQQVWNMVGGNFTDEEFNARLAGFDPSTVERTRSWRKTNMEFLKNCSPDLVFITPMTNSEHIELWCQVETQGHWGRLEGWRVWWFESEANAAAFEQTWNNPGVNAPGRAWRRKHGI